MTWTQVYDPLHNWVLSTLVAALPILVLFGLLAGLRLKPHWGAIHAAALNLLANTSPVAWGAIGTPVHTLAAVSGLPESDLSAMIGRILPITGIIVPFWLVRAMVSWSETLEVLPAILVVGVSFSAIQYLWSNHVDSNLVDIFGGAISLVVTVIFLRFWQPQRTCGIEHYRRPTAAAAGRPRHTPGQVVTAGLPFALSSVFVLVWGLPSVKGAMNRATTPIWDVPYLHNAVTRAAPVVTKLTPEAARYDFKIGRAHV